MKSRINLTDWLQFDHFVGLAYLIWLYIYYHRNTSLSTKELAIIGILLFILAGTCWQDAATAISQYSGASADATGG